MWVRAAATRRAEILAKWAEQASEPQLRGVEATVYQLREGATVSDRYVIKRQLGRGGMAAVYEAVDLKLDRDVALKVLPAVLTGDPSFVARFRREGQTLAKLSHPNIIRLFDCNDDPELGLYFLSLDFLPGGTLKHRIRGRGPWDPAAVVELFRPIAAALDYAHSRETPVIHCDLKPSNILFGEGGQPVIGDFGLSQMMTPDFARGPREGWGLSFSVSALLGTPPYVAPEQIEGQRPTPRSDLYALGTVAYVLLVGQEPFTADTPAAALMQIVAQPLPMPRQSNPRIHPRVEHVLVRALARNPEHRFSSASEFVEAVSEAAEASNREPSQFQRGKGPDAFALQNRSWNEPPGLLNKGTSPGTAAVAGLAEPWNRDTRVPFGYGLRMVTGRAARGQGLSQWWPFGRRSARSRWALVRSPWEIGRPGGTVPVDTDLSNVPNRLNIHRNHCCLTFDASDNMWFVTHQGDRHPTDLVRANGAEVRRLRANERVPINCGDEIRLSDGCARFVFERTLREG